MGKRVETVIKRDGADMYKFGHIELDITEVDLKRSFAFGDLLKVTIDSVGSFVMPFCRYYDEVGMGELVLCTYTKDSFAVIARNYKSLGVELGLLDTDINNGNYRLRNTSNELISVSIELVKKAEHSASWFENYGRVEKGIYDFRMVGGGTMRDNAVFRSSSPIDGRLSDCTRVDDKAKETRIESIINLADTQGEAEQFSGFHNTYCSGCRTVYLNMPLDVTSAAFRYSVRSGITFIAENKPPYLVFCSEGRDRTGLFVALLQVLCGVDLSRIMSDYTYSFVLSCNDAINEEFIVNIEKNIMMNLCLILGVKEVTQESLPRDAEKFLLSTGLKYELICKAKSRIEVR